MDIFNYQRQKTSVVKVGEIAIGGDNPIRVQSMTTTNTNATEACVEQAERIIKAGGELVRLTTQGLKEAKNMKNIREGIRKDGYNTPLIADVHFNPNVADVAAEVVEGVRINPGNYVDPARKFIKKDYTDEEYQKELAKIGDRFVPFLNICKANHTAIRIGVNHGSLSDRIRNRYGVTPKGIVESCLEFLRICEKEHFNDVVISIKSSNTVVMVRSVRLLVEEMIKEDMHYPLHLGVTEAGNAEDGRIKSAVGIGALLADGIGDTLRVSLTEEPEEEIPVAIHLVNHFKKRENHPQINAVPYKDYHFSDPQKRKTKAIKNIGGDNLPVVITNETGENSDYIYMGSKTFQAGKDKHYIVDFTSYEGKENTYPIFPANAMPLIASVKAELKFLILQYGVPSEEYIACLKFHPEVVVVCISHHQNRLGDQRAMVHELMIHGVLNPVIMAETYESDDKEEFILDSSADLGALMIDGFTDGVWLMNNGNIDGKTIEETAFGILQAGRLRMSKNDYISCPGCGRTLYDLRDTISKIKEATKDIKGLKIGIMGCIVNGPGEMADADYGYVGAGPKRISLYRKQECVEKNIPEEEAVEHLLQLINKDQNDG